MAPLELVSQRGHSRKADNTKRGVVAQSFPTTRELSGAAEIAEIQSLKPTWYYNYNPTTDISTPGIEFVPMFYDSTYVTSPNLAAVAGASRVLGFNEPDLASQANMTVAQAVALWPSIVAAAPSARIGSPACATDMSANTGWFHDFMTDASAPHVDFVCVHIYETAASDPITAANGVLTYLDAVHTRWGLPILLTEVGKITFTGTAPTTWSYDTQAHNDTYMRLVVEGCRSRSYIEGVCWYFNIFNSVYTPTAGGNLLDECLADATGALTSLGASYALMPTK